MSDPGVAYDFLDLLLAARRDVAVTNSRTGAFQNIASFPFRGSALPVARRWGSTDVRVQRASLRLVGSHLEAFDKQALRPVHQVDYSYARLVEWTRELIFDNLDLREVSAVGQDCGGCSGSAWSPKIPSASTGWSPRTPGCRLAT